MKKRIIQITSPGSFSLDNEGLVKPLELCPASKTGKHQFGWSSHWAEHTAYAECSFCDLINDLMPPINPPCCSAGRSEQEMQKVRKIAKESGYYNNEPCKYIKELGHHKTTKGFLGLGYERCEDKNCGKAFPDYT